MSIVTERAEVMVRIPNSPAAVAHLLAIARTCETEVLVARPAWEQQGVAVRLIAANAQHVTRVLEANGFPCVADSIVLVEAAHAGAAAFFGAALTRASIQVLYSYAFHTPTGAGYVVFRTTDNARAVAVLKTNALVLQVAAAKQSPCRPELDAPETAGVAQAA